MQALYDTETGALSLDLEEPAGQAVHGEDCAGLVVALAADGRVVSVEALEVDGIQDALAVAAGKFDLDLGLLRAAAGAALAAPDRQVVIEVARQTRSAA